MFCPFPCAYNLQKEKRYRLSSLSEKEGIAEEIRFLEDLLATEI